MRPTPLTTTHICISDQATWNMVLHCSTFQWPPADRVIYVWRSCGMEVKGGYRVHGGVKDCDPQRPTVLFKNNLSCGLKHRRRCRDLRIQHPLWNTDGGEREWRKQWEITANWALEGWGHTTGFSGDYKTLHASGGRRNHIWIRRRSLMRCQGQVQPQCVHQSGQVGLSCQSSRHSPLDNKL